MKFMYFFLPTLPATLEERRRLRPIAMHPDRWQKMIEEVVELAQVAEDAGLTAVSYPEHHLHSEGIEMGSLPVLTQHILHHTKKIMAGPIGYVLPGWNPLRLALEIAWLDQLTKGRTMVVSRSSCSAKKCSRTTSDPRRCDGFHLQPRR